MRARSAQEVALGDRTLDAFLLAERLRWAEAVRRSGARTD
jgi:hypothetical protein